MADDDIIRGGLDIVTDKTKKKKPKADQETAQPTAARFKKLKADQETAQPTAARFNKLISNSVWTEWSTIQGVIARVISKSDEREADLKLRTRLLPELYETRSNY